MKNLIAFTLLAVSFSGLAASKSDDVDMETLAAAKLKEMGVDTSAETAVKKDPASGFWTCNGIRLHMGVDLTSWQNLDDGDMFLRTTPPEPENNKAVAVHGMAYTFSSTKNPAVSKFFLIDKSGKKLYMYDDLEFSKLHPCKRDQ
ncbi:hypothetical protein RZD54_001656 [Citrobacter freundii]|uniref:hypothetical protein n=1 Tax=Enterobacteriaceae TaxID=543 RepID=UPI001BCCA876|nr:MULTISPECIES: hypothetical protein [Enterobacteriaceae]ELO0986306.1 hypothetical protein [Citrobacter freundii]ELO1021723.1 hypothetical protein [Citrobacter freundii]MDL4164308.1 hypothetical protein [Salmonella enterica]MDL4172963.1 hypothetical protein [Salmonella enterica]MDL4203108.1 hypothetical protein [Salmonella enterica]